MFMSSTIWWIRRDLRLADNQTLQAALQQSEQIIPVFILDTKLLASRYIGEKRLAFLLHGLRSLDSELRKRGSRLILRQGNPLEELNRLVIESGAQNIYAEPDYSPYAVRRDTHVAKKLRVAWTGSPAILPPGLVTKPDGDPYTIFTPFSRAWKSLFSPEKIAFIPAPESISTPENLASMSVPEYPALPDYVSFEASEEEAARRLNSFTQEINPKIESYATNRDRQDLNGTSQLSPYLRFGLISARQVAATAWSAYQAAENPEGRKGAEIWLNELIWRDFYIHILYHYPQVRRENFRLPHVKWDNRPEMFQAWCEGKTGYPSVDAAMHQLVISGWMHNRSRMIVASFLTKDLLIDWRLGEEFFMQHLIDGDPAANNGGWQWTAGTGTDAAPYFRIFNPVSQSLRHDPNGVYIRQWIPELRSVPDKYIHNPWKMPLEIQKQVRCMIGVDYPFPIVDHNIARDRALRAYGKPVNRPV